METVCGRMVWFQAMALYNFRKRNIDMLMYQRTIPLLCSRFNH